MMKWFGEPWRLDICRPEARIEVPVGARCGHCQERLLAGEQGVLLPYSNGIAGSRLAYHLDCSLRLVIGGLNHLQCRCACYRCKGTEPPDPPEMTVKEAARQAVLYWELLMHSGNQPDHPPKQET